jgi:plasmid stabilization system protein ParE
VTRYRYLPAAREDLNEAAAFYQVSVPGLGDAFLDDVERAIEDVCENPRIGAPITRAFRRAVLRRFPFTIVYAERDDEIVIVAIAHDRRRPGYWRGRQ